ncbi:MAG: Gfo/Idh/MocA family oxidoreductase [Polyangiaceae bacterium]|nr:Gfo/Idh/MocA family oxidoreductase [Polyangiaceae bacterium]
MKALILGYSRLVARRVHPAMRALDVVSSIDIASRRPEMVPPPSGEVFGDYSRALDESSAELVYVSTVNAEHARWVEAALASGRHVVVDKPAFLEAETARRLAELARSGGRVLAEATVYAHHPQFQLVREAFRESAPMALSAVFSFPALADRDFRYRRDAGGGALYDLGPYAVSPGRILFGVPPARIECQITARAGAVETGFDVLASYPGGRGLVGHFGFGTPYVNRLDVLGAAARVTLERAFTSPVEVGTEVRRQLGDHDERVVSEPGDAFLGFLKEVAAAIEVGQGEHLRRALVDDAEALERLRRAAGEA